MAGIGSTFTGKRKKKSNKKKQGGQSCLGKYNFVIHTDQNIARGHV